MAALADEELRSLIRTDPDNGWRVFIDQYTPLIVGLIRRAGLNDRDEIMEVYVVICERLSEHRFERLKSQDAMRGSIGGWLAVVARHACVDWIRSRKGRRRLFQAVQRLPEADQRVFEHYYWEERTPAEIAAIEHSDVASVLASLERIHEALTDRHRAELLSLAVRAKAPVSLNDTDVAERAIDPRADAEMTLRIAQMNGQLDTALRQLPAEDAAIVRLKFVEGLANSDIERSLGVAAVTTRLRAILIRLRAALEQTGLDSGDVVLTGSRS